MRKIQPRVRMIGATFAVFVAGLVPAAAFSAYCTDVTPIAIHVGRVDVTLPSGTTWSATGSMLANSANSDTIPWGSSLGYNASSGAYHDTALGVQIRELSTTSCGYISVYYGVGAEPVANSCGSTAPSVSWTRTYNLDTCAGGNGNTFAGGVELKFIDWGDAKFGSVVYAYIDFGVPIFQQTSCYRVWYPGCTNCC